MVTLASGLQLIMTHNAKPEKVITSHLQCPDIIRTHITTESQSIEMILNKIANPFNKTSSLCTMKEHESWVQDIFCMKFSIEGQRIHLLDSIAYSARFDLIQAELAALPSW